MDFLTENWLLIMTALTSGGLLLWPQLRGGGAGVLLAPAEAVMLMNREKALLIDVAEPAEFEAGHAGPALSLPFGQLEFSPQLPADKQRPIVLICPTGARARRAADLLRKAGHARVLAVAGGLKAWREAQLPVERGPAAAPARRRA